MLGCVVARMGIALLPKSVLATFSANAVISVHNLTSKESRVATVLIWRKGARSPKTEAFRQILGEGRGKRSAKKKH
jgi:DNA-binding transcriptional LysR family regulator